MMDKLFTQEQIDKLPTILGVVEQISSLENESALRFISSIPSPEHLDEGRFCFVSEGRNREFVRLMPTSQSPFNYYRGQSKYHSPCVPTLYRGQKNGELPSEFDIAGKCLKICEFTLLVNTHPVYRYVSKQYTENPIALAQHYGLDTFYLDITNSKWVAAFFAATRYDWETDTYHPVGRDYGDGFGVMYLSKYTDIQNIPDKFFEKNGVIGYQYFERPTKQSSFGYGMSMGEDFNESPFFDKVFFRHDLVASQIVYSMAYNQNRFIPRDLLSKLARMISVSKEVTRNAVGLCLQMFYADREQSFLDEVCRLKGWRIREDNTPIAEFGKAVLEADWNDWVRFGRADIESRTLPIIPLADLEIPEK